MAEYFCELMSRQALTVNPLEGTGAHVSKKYKLRYPLRIRASITNMHQRSPRLLLYFRSAMRLSAMRSPLACVYHAMANKIHFSWLFLFKKSRTVATLSLVNALYPVRNWHVYLKRHNLRLAKSQFVIAISEMRRTGRGDSWSLP
jgi:hypothetical protein